MLGGTYGNVFGLIILVLDIIAIIGVVGTGMDTVKKVLWILAILFLPLIGMILWFLIGRKGAL